MGTRRCNPYGGHEHGGKPARVYKMSHAELFAELMRVHTEANRLATDLQAQIDELKKDGSNDCAGV